jgi:hypothetical protein
MLRPDVHSYCSPFDRILEKQGKPADAQVFDEGASFSLNLRKITITSLDLVRRWPETQTSRTRIKQEIQIHVPRTM